MGRRARYATTYGPGGTGQSLMYPCVLYLCVIDRNGHLADRQPLRCILRVRGGLAVTSLAEVTFPALDGGVWNDVPRSELLAAVTTALHYQAVVPGASHLRIECGLGSKCLLGS